MRVLILEIFGRFVLECPSTKLECRADPRSEWLSRLKRRLSSGSVVTRGFESRSDIFRLQTVLVELLVEHLLYYRFYTNRLLNVMLNESGG